MSSLTGTVVSTSTDQVSVTVVQKFDQQSVRFILDKKTRVHDLKINSNHH